MGGVGVRGAGVRSDCPTWGKAAPLSFGAQTWVVRIFWEITLTMQQVGVLPVVLTLGLPLAAVGPGEVVQAFLLVGGPAVTSQQGSRSGFPVWERFALHLFSPMGPGCWF